MTSTWDNNGACVECGYTPFQLTEFCSECNPTKISNKFKENEKIKNIEEGLFQHGVQYLFMKDLVGMPIIYQDDYDDLDKYLRTYKHVNYFITPFTGEKVFDPEKQLVTRVKEFLKTTIEYNSMDEFDEFDEVKEEEISYCIDKPQIENVIPYIHIRNQAWNKIKEIDEDTSSYDEMFEALEAHNKNCCNENIHFMEDQIYRRFIKDIANKKLNINEIINLSDKIKKIIIDPNDGAWESCRWYA
jgi:hypothetical protein